MGFPGCFRGCVCGRERQVFLGGSTEEVLETSMRPAVSLSVASGFQGRVPHSPSQRKQ